MREIKGFEQLLWIIDKGDDDRKAASGTEVSLNRK